MIRDFNPRSPQRLKGVVLFSLLGLLAIGTSAYAAGPSIFALSAPVSMDAGHSAAGAVTLSEPAPDGGAQILFTSSDTGVLLVSNDSRIPKGERSAKFSLYAKNVTARSSATVTASYNGSSQSATVNVNPGAPPTVSLSSFTAQSPVNGGGGGGAEVDLSANAGSGGVKVSIASDSSLVTCDGSVTVAAGSSSRRFLFRAGAVDAPTTVHLTASLGDTHKTAEIHILPAHLGGLSVDPKQLVGGKSGHGYVGLEGAAGSSGVPVLSAVITQPSPSPVRQTSLPANGTRSSTSKPRPWGPKQTRP